MLPVPNGQDCFGWSGAGYSCCLSPAAQRALARFDLAFRTHGLLVHTVRGDWPHRALQASHLSTIPVDHDCGEWCGAYTLLVPELPLSVFDGQVALFHEANPEVWEQVQCASVLDSKSANRACCACWERQWCPFEDMDDKDSGYCGAPCTGGSAHDMERCKQLAAGCGMSTVIAHYERFPEHEPQSCSGDAIKGGQCAYCEQPQWCDDASRVPGKLAGDINTVDKWMERFALHGGGSIAMRQCKFTRSQREAFIATAAEYNRHRVEHRDREDILENEVNLYLGPGDGGVQRVLMENLVGLVVLRVWADGDDAYWFDKLSKLRAHLKELGLDVPVYSLTTERKLSLQLWAGHQPRDVDVLSSPYNLRVLEA